METQNEPMAQTKIIVPASLDRTIELEVADRRCKKKELLEFLIRLGLKNLKQTDLRKQFYTPRKQR